MEDETNQLVFTTRDPLLSSSNVALTVNCNLSQTFSSACFSTPLNSPLLLNPSTPLWSPVSAQSLPSIIPQEGVTSQTFNSDEDFQTPEVLGEIVIGDEDESDEEDAGIYMRNSGSSSGRARTPRTINRLLEQHRTSERNRHHDLNATINHICSAIPGYSPHVRETKIIKLQRIINYICHIESHIHSLCDEIGVTLDFKNLFLSAKTNDSMEGNPYAIGKEYSSRTQHHFEPEAPIPYSISKRMKRRSPTLETTVKEEEEELEWLKSCSGLDSPDADILTPDDCDQILSSFDVGAQVTVAKMEDIQNDQGNFSRSVPSTPFTGIYDSHQAFQRVPFTQSSPWPGKRSYQRSSHSEALVPSTPVTVLRRSQRRRVLRSPLLRLASLFKDSSSEEEDKDENDDDDFKCAAVPYDWNRQGSNGPDSEMLKKSKKGKINSKSQVDHRKTSWMNGFMMYSRIHRRRYISENPGVHTSHISKLMGHDWRSMTAEEQKPYKEKAGQYTKQFLMPTTDRSMTRSPEVKEMIETGRTNSTTSHLVPCFHRNTEETTGFHPIEPAATPCLIKREVDDDAIDKQSQQESDKENLQSNQLLLDTEATNRFTKLSSSPSKRVVVPAEPLDVLCPLNKHAVHGEMSDIETD